MKVIGTGSVHLYEGADECPHVPENDPEWQESFVLVVWDPRQHVYAFLRLGQEPYRNGGHTAVWLNLWVPGHMYKHTDDCIPMKADDRGRNWLSAHGGLCRYEYDGTHHWTINDQEVRLDVRMKDDHPGFGYYPESSGAAISQNFKHHIEAAGTVTGSISVKGKTYEVAGPGWRDHSWGKRNWLSVLTHRFYPALFGPEFSFFGLTMLGIDGKMAKLGTIVRGDTVEATSDFDIVAYIGEDGVSNMGGEVTLRMNGRSHQLRFQPIGKGAVSFHHNFPCVDTPCLVTMDGKQGVGFSETSNRPQGGTGRPFVFNHSRCVLENGLHARDAGVV